MSRATWPTISITIAYLFVGALYASLTPAWQAPDEPAHYNYVRQLAAGRLPVIEPGDYDQGYQERVIGSRFDPTYSIDPFRYEDWQPPLYYLLLAPVFVLSDGALLPLRLVSVLMGAGVILFSFAIIRRMWPDNPWAAPATAAFVAFLPQHVAILASVNNDALAELLIAAILWRLAGWVQRPRLERVDRRSLFLTGLLLGLGFVTKGTAYIMAPLAALVLLWRANWQLRRFVRLFGTLLLPALGIGALWWWRNVLVYPGLDWLALGAHDAVVTGQPRTADWVAQYGAGETAVRFVRTTFNSFWGQFGWMGVPMPRWVYQALTLFTVGTAAGLVLRLTGGRPLSRPSRLLLIPLFLLSSGLYLSYNITFVQHQGRYLFPALIPIGAAVAAGWSTLLRPLQSRWPATIVVLPLGLAAGLIALDLLALFRFIIPNLR